jgi:hypothetical protein
MVKFDDLPRTEIHRQESKSYLVVFENDEVTAFFRPDQITSVEMAQLAVDDREKPVRGSEIRLADDRNLMTRDHPGCVLSLVMKS